MSENDASPTDSVQATLELTPPPVPAPPTPGDVANKVQKPDIPPAESTARTPEQYEAEITKLRRESADYR